MAADVVDSAEIEVRQIDARPFAEKHIGEEVLC